MYAPPPPAADGEKTTAAIAALNAQLAGAAAVRLDDYGDLWTLCQFAPYVAYEYAERIHLRAALSEAEADAARDVSDAYLDQHLRAMAAHERAKAASAVKDTAQQRGQARGRSVRRGAGLYDGAHQLDAQVAMARAAAALVAPLLDRDLE